MGLQLIFVVETNKRCKSDWIYIKDTIDRFFSYDLAHVRLSTVYLNGKGNYRTKEKEISLLESKYRSTSKDNYSQVIMCLDCDDYDMKSEDKLFLSNAKQYCKEKEWDFVWFCKDIERVYLGKKVSDGEKKDESAKFKAKKGIELVKKSNLTANTYGQNTSNIINVLKKYLAEK